MSDKASGAKQAVQNMLFYYLTTLLDQEDPKQIMASEMGAMIELSEEQLNYVKLQLSAKNKVLDNFETCIKLLESMVKTGELDIDSLKIVIQVLSLMKATCEATLEALDIEQEEDSDE